mmetsp:Transcript_9398/g.24133  ORF Transcript_9398/g.24133 Transcript_9398/m.24133 type:complete len:372 (+) Transcript_9398:96-1211(+)
MSGLEASYPAMHAVNIREDAEGGNGHKDGSYGLNTTGEQEKFLGADKQRRTGNVLYPLPENEKTKAIKVAAMILSYYFANTFVVTTNKELISVMGFRFPMLLTCLHMSSSIVFSYIMIDVAGVFKKQQMTSSKQRRKVFYLAAMFAGTVLCGNASLQFLSVSFIQMVGASTPFFVCLLGFILFHEVHHWRGYCALLPIVGGAIISTYGEGHLVFIGLILAILSTAIRGLKSVWQGHLLTGEEKLDSPNLLKFMSMYGAVLLLVSAILFEGGDFLRWLSEEPSDFSSRLAFGALLVINPIGAYVANMAQFMITKTTSALTLQVIGNSKGAFTVLVSIIVFQDSVSAMAAVGYSITLAGVAWYTSERRKRQSS